MSHLDPVARAAYRREWLARNQEKMRAYWRDYYLRNRERHDAQGAEWRLKNPERSRAQKRLTQRRWYVSDPVAARAAVAKWQRAHPEYNRHYAKLTRAKRRGAIGTHTMTEWREKCELFANRCAYCGEFRPLHREHKMPLIRGGTDYITNIVPACAPCNLKKGTKTVAEFLALTH